MIGWFNEKNSNNNNRNGNRNIEMFSTYSVKAPYNPSSKFPYLSGFEPPL